MVVGVYDSSRVIRAYHRPHDTVEITRDEKCPPQQNNQRVALFWDHSRVFTVDETALVQLQLHALVAHLMEFRDHFLFHLELVHYLYILAFSFISCAYVCLLVSRR
jgi:hypothetical protein